MLYASNGGTAFPIPVLTEPKLPVNRYSSGKDCRRAASRMVNDLVAMGWTFLHPEIIPNVVCTVDAGSFHTCLL